jgi:hypothetical protein
MTGTRECAAKRSILPEGADHDDVGHAGDDLRRVFDRLTAPKLGIARVQEDRVAAELVNAGFERQARTRGILLEDHGQRAVVQRVPRLVVLELGLEDRGTVQQVFVLFQRKVLELQVVLDRAWWVHKTTKAACR